jgi:hypothetical protein
VGGTGADETRAGLCVGDTGEAGEAEVVGEVGGRSP